MRTGQDVTAIVIELNGRITLLFPQDKIEAMRNARKGTESARQEVLPSCLAFCVPSGDFTGPLP